MSASLEGYCFSQMPFINPEAIQNLRQAAELGPDSYNAWMDALGSLGVASAWHEEDLVGIGFLTGSLRHAVLCDLTVHPDHRRQGIATELVDELLWVADKRRVAYLTLYYDERQPWLAGFYGKFGLEPITNAMQRSIQ